MLDPSSLIIYIIFSKARWTYPGALDELVLAGSDVLLLASPCAEHGSLQGTTVREGQSPWADQRNLVDGAQVDGGLLLGLTTRQEGDTCQPKKSLDQLHG